MLDATRRPRRTHDVTTTDPQLLEMLKLAAWQQAVIGLEAAWGIRQALRIDDSPPPPIAPDELVAWLFPEPAEALPPTPAQRARDLVDKPAMNRRVRGVWAGTQLFLSAAANVSKLLWPPARDSDAHCEELRVLLGVDDSWALRDRRLRDGFEHFGQRIVEWIASNPGQRFSDSRILQSADIESIEGTVPMRTFIEDSFAVRLLGREFALVPLEGEMRAIRDAASPGAGLYLQE